MLCCFIVCFVLFCGWILLLFSAFCDHNSYILFILFPSTRTSHLPLILFSFSRSQISTESLLSSTLVVPAELLAIHYHPNTVPFSSTCDTEEAYIGDYPLFVYTPPLYLSANTLPTRHCLFMLCILLLPATWITHLHPPILIVTAGTGYEHAAGFASTTAESMTISLVDDIRTETRDTRTILASCPVIKERAGENDSGFGSDSGTGVVGEKSRRPVGHPNVGFSLMWQIRLQRLMCTMDSRRVLLEAQFQAVAILLSCYQDATMLSQFFSDKTDVLRDLLFLLRTGPGSVNYRFGAAPLSLRTLAVQCVTAVVGSRESVNASVLGVRFSWLQHDLGVNRGQYMGLLPCILRSLTSFLVSEEVLVGDEGMDEEKNTHSMVISTSTSTPSSRGIKDKGSDKDGLGLGLGTPIIVGDEYEEYMMWTETVLGLLLALISLTTALPALTDNGIISSIATVLGHKHQQQQQSQPQQTAAAATTASSRAAAASNISTSPDRLSHTIVQDRTTRTHIDSLIALILDTAISSHTAAFTVFKDQGGAEQCLHRTLDELTYVADPATVVTETDDVTAPVASSSASSGASCSASSSASSSSSSSSSGDAMAVDGEDDDRRTSDGFKLNLASSEALAAANAGSKWRIGTIPAPHKVLLNQLLCLNISWVQDSLQDGSDHFHAQLLKSPAFARLFGVIFANPAPLTHIVVGQALSLIADSINSDPAPPALLLHTLSSGVAEMALQVIPLCPVLYINLITPHIILNTWLCK